MVQKIHSIYNWDYSLIISSIRTVGILPDGKRIFSYFLIGNNRTIIPNEISTILQSIHLINRDLKFLKQLGSQPSPTNFLFE